MLVGVRDLSSPALNMDRNAGVAVRLELGLRRLRMIGVTSLVRRRGGSGVVGVGRWWFILMCKVHLWDGKCCRWGVAVGHELCVGGEYECGSCSSTVEVKKDVTISVSLFPTLRRLRVYHVYRSEGSLLATWSVDEHHIPARVSLVPSHCLHLAFSPLAAAHILVAANHLMVWPSQLAKEESQFPAVPVV